MIAISTKGKPAKYSGYLITFEGPDGSGKTTNLTQLQEWLEYRGYKTLWTDWGTSYIGETLTKGRDRKLLKPMPTAMIQAASVADRLQDEILPHLNKGGIVLADRYIYTIYARNAVRGVDRKWLRELCRFAPQADLAVYFKLPLKVALERKTTSNGPPNITYYEAGMDMKLADNRLDGYLKFQARVCKEYEDVIVPEFGFKTIDADRDLDEVNVDLQKMVLDLVGKPVDIEPENEPKAALGGNY